MPTPTRTHGTLSSWNDERGFGFITPAQGIDKVFVHISAFPHDGRRPTIGEVVSFDLETDAQGRKRALRIARPGGRRPSAKPRTRHRAGRKRSGHPLAGILGLLAIIAIGALAYSRFQQRTPPQAAPAATIHTASALPTDFHCDGRKYCSQMRSCAEATRFLKHCPDMRMDGDGDGIPCEQQWCTR